MVYDIKYLEQLTIKDISVEPPETRRNLLKDYAKCMRLDSVTHSDLVTLIKLCSEVFDYDDSAEFNTFLSMALKSNISHKHTSTSMQFIANCLSTGSEELTRHVCLTEKLMNDSRFLLHFTFLWMYHKIHLQVVTDFIGDTVGLPDSVVDDTWSWLTRYKWSQDCVLSLAAMNHTISTLYKREFPRQCAGELYPYEDIPAYHSLLRRCTRQIKRFTLPEYEGDVNFKLWIVGGSN